MKELGLLFSWTAYFYLHSLLAAIPVKRSISQLLSIRSPRIYRIGYNLFFLAGLILLVYWQLVFPSTLLFSTRVTTNILAFCLMIPGLVIMMASIKNYDWKSYAGITNEKSHSLVIKGMNKYARHPLYSGTMLFLLGFLLWEPSYKNLWVWLLMWVYLAIGMRYEEKKLVNTYGTEYENYQKKVKKMIPFIW